MIGSSKVMPKDLCQVATDFFYMEKTKKWVNVKGKHILGSKEIR